jgi:hypothetical protein
MTDRELLELAAKAAGMPAHIDGVGFVMAHHPSWNPLTDDGDALRLAVKLGDTFLVKVGIFGQLDKTFCHIDSVATRENLGTDPYAATRRAIVRAAAEIGRNMT